MNLSAQEAELITHLFAQGKSILTTAEAEKEWHGRAAVAYWSALNYWEMTEQMQRITFIQSPKRKRDLVVLRMRFQFLYIQEERFFGIAERKVNIEASSGCSKSAGDQSPAQISSASAKIRFIPAARGWRSFCTVCHKMGKLT